LTPESCGRASALASFSSLKSAASEKTAFKKTPWQASAFQRVNPKFKRHFVDASGF